MVLKYYHYICNQSVIWRHRGLEAIRHRGLEAIRHITSSTWKELMPEMHYLFKNK